MFQSYDTMKRHASRSKRPKTRYKVKNWPAYNEALVNRGNITMWIEEGSEKAWYHEGTAQRGAQFVYSDEAIKIGLTVRQIFHLPFRQTEGFLLSITRLMGMRVRVPDYSVLCRRMKNLAVQVKPGKHITDLVFDGSGLKVFGEGEWKVRQHGPGKRRTWRKLYIGLDPESKAVQVVDVTLNSVHDADAAKSMLEQHEMPDLKRFYGDGGFDKWKVYEILEKRNVKPIIPPQKNARIKRHGNSHGKPLARDKTIRIIRKKGRKRWKVHCGYHKRSLSENFFFRYKTVFGDHLKSRISENQKMEVILNTIILNKMIKIGKPESYKVRNAA